MTENAEEGTDTVEASSSFTLGDNVENLVLTGAGKLSGTGNALDNAITGNSGNNVLDGLDGNDKLSGGDGNDKLDGGLGADHMEGGAGNDTFIVDDAGDKVIEKADGGNDLVKASVSFSLGGQAIEKLTLTGKANIDGTGNGLDNALTGNAGKNELEGQDGNDLLNGSGGNDLLHGGKGADELLGGAGRDTFVFKTVEESTASKNGRDTIDDFSHAQHDHIDLSAIDAKAGKGNQDFHFIGDVKFSHTAGELRLDHSHGDVIVQGDIDGDGKADFAITVHGLTDLVAKDFLL